MSGGASPPLPPLASFRRTISLTFATAGRANRTELGSYVACAAVILLAVSFIAALFAPYPVRARVSDALTLALAAPVPALLIRRAHDQGRSGWLAALALIGATLWIARSSIAATMGLEARIAFDKQAWPLDWLATIANISVIAFVVLPGTPGPNRFGPAPDAQPD